jgi:hypothetical protein
VQGRPRKRGPEDRTTSVSLDKEARLAIKRLQLHREAKDRPSTFRDIVREGLALLLIQEGLEPMKQPETIASPAVVEITKR